MNNPQQTGIWAHELFVKALVNSVLDEDEKQHAMWMALAALDAEAREAVESDEPDAIEKLEVRNGFGYSLARYLDINVSEVAEQIRQIRAGQAQLSELMASDESEA